MAQDSVPEKSAKRSGQPDDEQEKDEVDGEHTALHNPQVMAAEMAKAFQELARGEQTASALERQLDGIESRIDQLLASVEDNSRGQGSEKADNIIHDDKKSS